MLAAYPKFGVTNYVGGARGVSFGSLPFLLIST